MFRAEDSIIPQIQGRGVYGGGWIVLLGTQATLGTLVRYTKQTLIFVIMYTVNCLIIKDFSDTLLLMEITTH